MQQIGSHQLGAAQLDKVAAGLNQTGTQPLMGGAPEDDEDTDILQFARRNQAGLDMASNKQITNYRAVKLIGEEQLG